MGAKTPSGTDNRDGLSDITRETLDGAPLTGWRAVLARWADRAGGWSAAEQSPAPLERASPRDAASGADMSVGRLTARRKLARVAVIALAVVVALGVGLGGFATAGRAVTALLFPPRPTPVLSTTPYTLRNLPALAQHLPHVSLAPLVDSASVAYACWVNPYAVASGAPVGQIMIARTANGGASWQPVAIPAMSAVFCQIITDGASGSGALLIAYPPDAADGSCQTPELSYHPGTYESVTTQNNWERVPWPASVPATVCDLQFALEGGAIYAWSENALVLPTGAGGRLIVTRDGGATWAAADAGMNGANGFQIVGFHSGGGILASVFDVRGPPGSAALMESNDYGAYWRSLGDLPGAFPTVYVSTDPDLPGGWGRLYVVARPLVGGAPSFHGAPMVATAAHIGGAWTVIPEPPLTTDDSPTAQDSLPVALGVGPAQSLIVQRGAVGSNDHGQITQAHWLWAWSVSQKRWLRDTDPGPGNVDVIAWSWSHGDQTWWLTALKLGVPPTLLLYTKTYPSAALK